MIEHREGTPHIDATALKAKLDAREDIVILDSRPLDEFQAMNIPGGLDCPGAELVYRVHELVRSPATLVVVNCAGRTRSIIGAQSLINAGLANRVVALKDGTMGWHLAGLELERGQSRAAPPPGPAALAKARAAAARVGERFGVRGIGAAELARFATCMGYPDATAFATALGGDGPVDLGGLRATLDAVAQQVRAAFVRYVGEIGP